ncbi:hypothetical protein M8494_15060 [Serratia ureilytica]
MLEHRQRFVEIWCSIPSLSSSAVSLGTPDAHQQIDHDAVTAAHLLRQPSSPSLG